MMYTTPPCTRLLSVGGGGGGGGTFKFLLLDLLRSPPEFFPRMDRWTTGSHGRRGGGGGSERRSVDNWTGIRRTTLFRTLVVRAEASAAAGENYVLLSRARDEKEKHRVYNGGGDDVRIERTELGSNDVERRDIEFFVVSSSR